MTDETSAVTPLTDALAKSLNMIGDTPEFRAVRDLERQLTAAQARAREVERKIIELEAQLKHLRIIKP